MSFMVNKPMIATEYDGDLRKVIEFLTTHFGDKRLYDIQITLDQDGTDSDQDTIWIKTPIEDMRLHFTQKEGTFTAFYWGHAGIHSNILSLDETLNQIHQTITEFLTFYEKIDERHKKHFMECQMEAQAKYQEEHIGF